jgi:hypothetical protein
VDLRLTGPQNTGYGWDTLISIEELTGGSGPDRFAGNAEVNPGTDKISLVSIDANTEVVGDQGFTLASGATDAALLVGQVNGDGKADFEIMIWGTGLNALSAADFILRRAA